MSPMQPMRQMWVPGSLLGSAIKLHRFPRLRPHHSCEINISKSHLNGLQTENLFLVTIFCFLGCTQARLPGRHVRTYLRKVNIVALLYLLSQITTCLRYLECFPTRSEILHLMRAVLKLSEISEVHSTALLSKYVLHCP